MAQQDKTTLEDFALKGNHLAKMTGISVATHAIPDAFLLMHSGVGCKYKTAAQVGPHDWGSHPNRREGWTQVGEVQLIRGSSARIGPFARTWYERRRPNFMPVVSAYFIELTGEDCRDVVAKVEETVPCDMAMLTTSAPNGGFYDGYADLTMEVIKRIDWKVEPKPGTASVIGYYFDRYEPDHQGNLRQLKQLLGVAGVSLGPVLLSGTPYTDLKSAGACEHLLMMPYMGKKARRVRRTTKRTPITVDLPIGMAGTAYFLRNVARETGGDLERVERFIEEQTRQTKLQLEIVSQRMRGMSLAIFADSPLAAGLYTICQELGLRVSHVGIRESYLGGKTAFIDVLERWGVPLSEETVVVENPSLRWIAKEVGDAASAGRCNGLLGSAHETRLFRSERSRRPMEHFFTLDIGFPSDDHHDLAPMPLFGFIGALLFTQRLYGAP